MIRQLKFFLVANLVYCIVRMMMYSWNHGYDSVFDLRFIQVIISMVGAAILAAIDEINKTLQAASIKGFADETPHFQSLEITYFQSLDIAPAPGSMNGRYIYIKDHARLYRSDGIVWIPLQVK